MGILALITYFVIQEISAAVTWSANSNKSYMFEVSQYKYSGQSSTTIYNVVQGSQTTYLYFLEYLSTSGTGVVRKESMDGNQAWLSAYSGKPSSSSLAISADENYVYYSVYTSPVPVIQINSSTGSWQSVIQL